MSECETLGGDSSSSPAVAADGEQIGRRVIAQARWSLWPVAPMSHPTPWWKCRAVTLLSMLSLLAPCPPVGAEGNSEDAVKPAFLSRFVGYAEWPSANVTGAQFTIAVLGADGVARDLQRLLPNYTLNQRPAQVRKLRNISELGDAQILYIGPSHLSDVRAALAAITTRPVLLVTDDEHGFDEGGAVNFLLVDQRARFEVSVLAAERSGLEISSELLAMAARVQSGRRRSDVPCGSTANAVEHGTSCTQRVAAGSSGGESRQCGDARAAQRAGSTRDGGSGWVPDPNP